MREEGDDPDAWARALSGGAERGDARLRAGRVRWQVGPERALRGSRPVWRTECGRELAWELAGPSGGVAKRAGCKSLALRERVLGRARGEAGLRGELGRAGLSFGFGLGWVCFPIYLGFLFSISKLFYS